jgi:heptaprenyl diphosphate synthase
MKKSNHGKIKKMCQLALFLAIGVILNIVESFIPLPIPIPGVRLGLANTIGLVLLYYYGPKEYAGIGFLRVVLVGLLRTGLFSVSFLLSLSGYFLSSLIAIFLYYLKKFSIYGLSVASAVFHGIGQMILVMIIYSSYGLVIYLPVLMFTGVISGLLTAGISSLLLLNINKHIDYLIK